MDILHCELCKVVSRHGIAIFLNLCNVIALKNGMTTLSRHSRHRWHDMNDVTELSRHKMSVIGSNYSTKQRWCDVTRFLIIN